MRRSAFLLSLLVAACGAEPEAPETPKAPTTYAKGADEARTPEIAVPPMASLTYVDVTAAAGIDHVHDSGAYGEKLLPETMGSGCAWIDHDSDGDPDLLLLNGHAWPGREGAGLATWRLYRNDGDMSFTDVTAEAGLAEPFYAMGVSACDTDGDGDTDLFVTGVGGYRFFVNEGGRFTNATDAAGLDPGNWTDAEGASHPPFATSAAFTDFDGDGRPDLFVAHYVHWSRETDVFSTIDGTSKSYAIPKQYDGESCRLWRNLGDNRFEDVTDAAGVRNDEGKSLGVCIFDFNEDGLQDIAVANDTQPDYLYRNDGGGRFSEIGHPSGVAVDQVTARARAGMGIDAIILPDTGQPALAVGNFSGEPLSFFELLRGELFVNRADVSGVSLATHHPLTFGVLFVDADLDARPDLLLVNGHIEPTIQSVHKDISYEQPMSLLRGVPGKRFVRFEDVSDQMGADFTTPRVGRGLAVADADGDGDLDVCVTSNGGRTVLLRCDLDGTAERSLRVRVVGTAPATDALGARVAVATGDRVQVRSVRTGSSYLSQSELTLTFGLGEASVADTVTVRWPDGAERVFEDVAPGTLVARPE